MRKLREYIDILNNNGQIVQIYNCDNILDITVENMTYNSKDVDSNCLFVCKGASFKKDYLIDALNQGAFVYVSSEKYDINLPCIIVKDIYASLSILSSVYFENPDNNLNVIGITGTKGKSTTAYYVKYVLDEFSRENNLKETAIISSIDTYDGVQNFESHITTPESFDLYNHFSNAVKSDMKNLVMEVSSQALKYNRVYTVNFDVGVFLNISEDHISPIEHPTFEDYFESKLKIFDRCKVACVNLDCDNSDVVLDRAKKGVAKRVITFSRKDSSADVYAYDIQKVNHDTVFKVKTPNYDREFILTMPGLFNVENALATICVSLALNIPDRFVYEGLKIARSSGRMEEFSSKDEKIVAIVDYAHNKLSFEALYDSTRNEYPGRRIVTIFGCPGKKAFIRRRDLGLLSGKNSDKVYLVAEDPGAEPVIDISKEIAKYVEEYTKNYEMIEDRGEAIEAAIKEAAILAQNTVILITGKGNETRQKYGTEYLPCKSDVEYVKEYLKEYDDNKMGVNN